MNASKLKHVISVDRHGSISAAAAAIGLSQSTVSRSVADVEKDIGYALFDRRARDVAATERGRQFINRAARIISDLDQLEEDARNSKSAGESLLRVGVSPASMQGLLNKAVTKLIFGRSDIRLQLAAMSEESGVRALRRGDIDILVGPENAIRLQASFSIERIGVLHTYLFARSKHPLSLKTTVTRDDIIKYPVIAPDRLSWHTEKLNDLFAAEGVVGSRDMHIVEYFPLIADIVAGSDAIGVISAEYAQSTAFRRRFALLNVAFFEALPIAMVVRKQWPPTPAMRAFQAALRESPPAYSLPKRGQSKTA